ncbi:MAG TPA: cohesin domain-containing protein, partial [Pyrinomonadaceae bacterium]|nr:cohesin domain-containing protein [Pyrinomonadaceae bacterium]
SASNALQVLPLSLSSSKPAEIPSGRRPELTLIADHDKLRTGEKATVKLMLTTDERLSSAAVTLKFDPAVLDLQGITPGGLFQNAATRQIAQFTQTPGELAVSISGLTVSGYGMLLTFTAVARTKGEASIELVRETIRLITSEGREMSDPQVIRTRVRVEP